MSVAAVVLLLAAGVLVHRSLVPRSYHHPTPCPREEDGSGHPSVSSKHLEETERRISTEQFAGLLVPDNAREELKL